MKIIILTLNSWSWNISKNFRAADGIIIIITLIPNV